MSSPLTYSKVPGAEVMRAMDAMQMATASETDQVIMMACFAIALCTAYPDIEQDDLKAGVKGASEWMAMYIQNIIDPPKQGQMN